MVMGEHKYVLEHTTDKIARALGNAFVAPIITYVPEGSWDNPRGHMTKAGTITLPNERSWSCWRTPRRVSRPAASRTSPHR